MKHLLAAATFAALLTAAPASAQTVYGVVTGSGNGTGVETGGNGDWKGSFVIYSTTNPIATATGPLPGLGVTDPIAFEGALIGAPAAFERSEFDHLSVARANATGAVPEPATWAMMLVGFGAVGGALRRRRKAMAQLA